MAKLGGLRKAGDRYSERAKDIVDGSWRCKG